MTLFMLRRVRNNSRRYYYYWAVNRGVNALRILGSFQFPSSQIFPFSFPLIQLGVGERCKLPQQVRAEPGHQTQFGAFWNKSEAFQGGDVLYCLCCKTPHRYRLVLRRHQPHNQLRWRRQRVVRVTWLRWSYWIPDKTPPDKRPLKMPTPDKRPHGQKTTKLVFLRRNLKSPDCVFFYSIAVEKWQKWRCLSLLL